MEHYAICGDDKCYTPVYTKEEIDEKFGNTATMVTGLPIGAYVMLDKEVNNAGFTYGTWKCAYTTNLYVSGRPMTDDPDELVESGNIRFYMYRRTA